jgi:tetratricopeptide (TPR) repeat protein
MRSLVMKALTVALTSLLGTTIAFAQSSGASTPLNPSASNAECRDMMIVRGQNKAALDYARKWQAARQNAESATCLAMALALMGEIREADSFVKAFEPDKLDPATQGDYFWTRSHIADSLGRANAALEFAKKSRAAYAKDDKTMDFAAEANVGIFNMLLALDREDEAASHLSVAEKLCRATWCKASATAARGSTLSDGEAARKLYAKAFSLYESIPDLLGMTFASISTAKSLIKDEQYAEAEKMLTRVRSLHQKVGSRVVEADLLHVRADLYRAQGETRQARENYEKSISLAREIGMNAIAKEALSALNELE